ncbi:MAG: aldehyde oxidase [Dethiosulfovibrio peptidovorans]|nr:MAG: aldehyde oxidase [Dethiosulfovibrio peptidovorans]
MNQYSVVGCPEVRKDGWEKVTGRAQYVDDIPLDGCWYGGVLRSPSARGWLKGIERDPGFDWSRVVVVSAADLPGPNMVASVRNDCPILAEDRVSYVTEPVALVAAPDRETLKAALAALTPVIEPDGEPVIDVYDALKGERLVWGHDNVLQTFDIGRGDLDEGFAQADLILDETYTTQHQEQVYLEPQGAFATPDPDGRGVSVDISSQCPFYVHNSVVQGLNFDPDRVVIRQTVTGGGFGGKEFYPSLVALHVAILALAAGRTVKMVFDRHEDLAATSKRHPSVTRIRAGFLKDGTLTAIDVDFILNGGATTTLSVVVLQRGVLHATSCYRVPNVRVLGRAVATNLPPSGAYRGFGVPQSLFAMERHMDLAAGRLGMDPVAIRRKNLLTVGDLLPCGQVLDQVAAETVLDRALERSEYYEKVERYSRENEQGGQILKGIGLSLFLHGGGFTGSGEDHILGKTKVVFVPGRTSEEGRLELRISNTEMGQGAATVLSQIVAQGLQVPLNRVDYLAPDTSKASDSGPTVASRTTVVVGAILTRSARDMLDKLSGYVSEKLGSDPSYGEGVFRVGDRCLTFWEVAHGYAEEKGELVGWGEYVSTGSHWDDDTSTGDAYPSYSWACDVVEVEVNRDTLEVVPTDLCAVVDIGTVINPILAEGQFEGGSLQALGYGWIEDMAVKGDRIDAGSLSKYLIPTTMDSPRFDVEFVEIPYSHGPYGAKGLGELPHDGGAPALAAAIGHALDVFPLDIPVTPERMTSMLAAKEERL